LKNVHFYFPIFVHFYIDFYNLINAQKMASYSRIKADYLCEGRKENDTLYMFVVEERDKARVENQCKGCSLFWKHEQDYTLCATKTTTLQIEKTIDGYRRIIYSNPSYIEK